MRKNEPLTHEQKRKIWELRDKGHTPKQIHQLTGLPRDRVVNTVRKADGRRA